MSAADIDCRAVRGLLTRWYDGMLTGLEADAFEQHILLCRPCQSQNDKLRTALSALSALARVPADPALVSRLAGRVSGGRAAS